MIQCVWGKEGEALEKKVPHEMSTLEGDPEIGKGSVLGMSSKQNYSTQKSRTHTGWKRESASNAAGEHKLTACYAQRSFSIWCKERIISLFSGESQAMTALV